MSNKGHAMPEDRDIEAILRQHLEPKQNLADELYDIARRRGARTREEIHRMLGSKESPAEKTAQNLSRLRRS